MSAQPGAGLFRARTEKINWNAVFLEGRALIALILIVVIFASMSDHYLTATNLLSMTRHVAFNAVLALGMLMVILHGGIDLSVGSTVGLSGVVAGSLLQGLDLSLFDIVAYPAVWVVVVVAVAVGALAGYVNGLMVTRFRVAPFVATLGMMYMARGAAMLIADGRTFPELQGDPELGNTGFSAIGNGRLLGIPMGVWIMIGVAVLVAILLTRTPFGRWLYSIGGNSRAAELSGVPVGRVVRSVYVISGMCAALVGLILASELTAATPQTGQMYELNAIAAVVIGGAALSGGRGTVRGTLIGAFVIGFLTDGLVIVGVSEFWQMVITGAVIVAAVALDQFQQRLNHTRRGPGKPGSGARPATKPAEDKAAASATVSN
ncbi:ABC transporter permease [Glycomyces xiaoerkulensis]|uniref:ABC transporter permease n=1 Tax=Glycomyces xiaoerkulensis TaxID=2038139 RepID=UPI000C268A3C|nr:ABC transporter permease [Glycomyces xiaoerkulensis]